jgi:hypothetical protein
MHALIRVAAGFIVALLCACAAQVPAPVPPGEKADGLDQRALAAQWWQWAMAEPVPTNPVRDRTGVHCAVGQRGNVWFLAGGFGSSKISRTCSIPAGRYVFFPIINMVQWPGEDDTGYTCARARQLVALNNDTAIDLFASIDGVGLQNLKAHRVRTEACFDVFARVPREAEPPRGFPAATDGYWLLLPPLAKGEHRISFGGRYNNQSDTYGRMLQDIEYRIVVE